MHLIIYLSRYTGQEEDIARDIEDIEKISKKINPDHNITGVFFYQAGTFLQAVEGEREELESLMSTLARDKRHKDIVRVVDTPVEGRSFPDWNMDTFNLDAEVLLEQEDLAKYKQLFSQNCEMDAALFIEMLKNLYRDAELMQVVRETKRPE